MFDGTHYLECACSSDEHTLRFTLDKEDGEIYTSVYLNRYLPWYKRAWHALRYVFGYHCKYGHWDCTVINREGAAKLRAILDEFDIDADMQKGGGDGRKN